MVQGFLEFLTGISAQYGTGNVVGDLLIVLISLTILAMIMGIVGVLRRSGGSASSSPGFERMSNIAGRVEKMERSVNEMRSDVMRNIEFLKLETQLVRDAVLSLKAEITPASIGGPGPSGPKGSGGGGLTGAGSGGSSSGPAGGGRDASAAKFSVRGLDHEVESLASSTISAELATPEFAPDLRLKPEPPPLSSQLAKTRGGFFSRLKGFFATKQTLDESLIDELEEVLISSDLGTKTTAKLLEELKAEVAGGSAVDFETLVALLKIKMLTLLESDAPLSAEITPERRDNGPLVIMVVGVNGAGKTTTIAKLAAQFADAGANVMLVAGDTFRAAASEQLEVWGTRLGVPVVTGAAGAKPATVVFDGVKRGLEEGVDVVIIDTAGRLHTKSNLMQELSGVRNAVERQQPGAPHEVLLVVDGNTGQNAITQAQEFNEATTLTGVVVTKLDGTAKGGVVVAIKEELGVPVRYIGVGESKYDLKPFVARDFIEALFTRGEEDESIRSTPPPDGSVFTPRPRRRRDSGEFLH